VAPLPWCCAFLKKGRSGAISAKTLVFQVSIQPMPRRSRVCQQPNDSGTALAGRIEGHLGEEKKSCLARPALTSSLSEMILTGKSKWQVDRLLPKGSQQGPVESPHSTGPTAMKTGLCRPRGTEATAKAKEKPPKDAKRRKEKQRTRGAKRQRVVVARAWCLAFPSFCVSLRPLRLSVFVFAVSDARGTRAETMLVPAGLA
jgi:hypothetical protein